jgi:hypothetical protein
LRAAGRKRAPPAAVDRWARHIIGPFHRYVGGQHGEPEAARPGSLWVSSNRAFEQRSKTMRYRVYVGSRGSEAISPLQKDQFLFKEFTTLDDAFGWARHVNGSGRVTLLIDGDDGTNLTKHEIAAALQNPGYSGQAA